MDAAQGVAFLTALGAQKIRIKENGWIEARCPLAPWTHERHADGTPSFGLTIAPGARSFFSCFACKSGSAEELVSALELYSHGTLPGADFTVAHSLLTDEVQVMPLPPYGTSSTALEFLHWPQYWLESFTPASLVSPALAYLDARGVPSTTIAQFDLRYDPKRSMIVCPYYDVFGRLAGARGQSILPATSGASKHYDYSWQSTNNCRLTWYDEGVLNLPGPAVIVEGQFDCWKTVRAFPKTLAALTAKPTFEKMKKLGDCPFIIQIPDNDTAGKQSTTLYAKYCAQLGIGHQVLWLPEGIKDPDEAHVDYLRDRIQEFL